MGEGLIFIIIFFLYDVYLRDIFFLMIFFMYFILEDEVKV